MNNLITQLKENGQDFEFYPTTKAMVRCIFEHHRYYHGSPRWHRDHNFGDVLDIGCGTCNFKTFVDELNEPLKEIDYGRECVKIHKYCVIEKSRILLERLPADAIVLGTDFHENTLIDKKVNTIFCNPPYSEYEDWAVRIIRESVCKDIYLIIPQRWKNSEKIKVALSNVKEVYSEKSGKLDRAHVIGSFDFLDAERAARASCQNSSDWHGK